MRSASPPKSPTSRRTRACASCPTGRRCPTTRSRRTRTSSRNGSRRCMTWAKAAATSCSCPRRPRSTGCRPASFLAAYTFSFTQGERLNEAKLKAQLTLAGYEHVSQVVRPGEYCVRGSLLDLFPMGSPLPYRIDLFDDQVDSIRAFDPDTQRSLYPVRDVRLLPGREFPFDEASRTAFRSRWREVFEGDPSRSSIYKDIGNGVPSAGIEYYLPLFFDETATLFHYLPEGAQLVFIGDMDASIKRFTNDTRQRYNFLGHDRERPLLEPRRLFLTDDDFFAFAKPFAQLEVPAHAGRRLGRAAAGSRARPSRRRAAARAAPLSRPDAEPRDARRGIGGTSRDDPADACRARPARRARRHLPAMARRRREILARRGAARERLRAARRGTRDRHRDGALRPARAPHRTAPPGAGEQRRLDGARPVGAEDRRSGRAYAARHRALHGARVDGPRRRRDRVPASRIPERKQALRAGRAVARDLALQRRRSRQRPAPRARLGPVGEGEAPRRAADPRYGRRIAQPVRPPRRARGLCVQARTARLHEVRGKLRLRGNARPGRGDHRRDRRHDERQADGPARLRRRRFRQDRSRAARGVHRGDGGQAGRDSFAHHAARRTAHADLHRSLRRLAGAHRGTLAVQEHEGNCRVDRRDQRRHHRHRDRHAQAACRRMCSSSGSGS